MNSWLVKSGLVGETTQYDKKILPDFRKPKSWLKSVSAFANGLGGKLIFGVADDDTLVGIEHPKEVSEKISEAIKDKMDPVPQIDLQIKVVNGKTLVILEVVQGRDTPYYFAGDGMHTAYVRIGNQSVRAQAHDLKRMVLRAERRSLDSLSTDYPRSKYTFFELQRLYKKQTRIVLEEKDYESFGLIDDKGFLTYAGALLADESPIRHSRVFCTRWNGLDKAGGLLEAWDDMEVSGSLANLFMETMNFIRRNNKMRWKKLASTRANMPEYPERAVQECVINALIHRDYLEIGSEVHVDIFDDRMEIFSPGGMLDGSQIQNLNPMEVRSKRRNPVIADVFNRMDLMERRGSGFKKIIDAYRNAYLYREDLLPRMYSNDVDFCVVLRNLNYGIEPDAVNTIENESFTTENESFTMENESFTTENESFTLTQFLEREKVPNKMREHIVAVYTRAKEEKVFSRKDIMEWLVFSASSAAGRVINMMKKLDLIEHAEGRGNGKYQFRKEVEGNDSAWLD